MTIRAILFDLDNTLYPASSGVMQQLDRRIGEYVQERLGLSSDEATALKRHYYATYGTTLRIMAMSRRMSICNSFMTSRLMRICSTTRNWTLL
jgi:putative hydrolase of the HAD superfamily